MTVASAEPDIEQWRTRVRQVPGVDARDVDELEAHLRDQMADLEAVGLAADEAFLVAVKRMGSVDDLAREFSREHSGRMWSQLGLGAPATDGDMRVAGVAATLGWAAAAGLALLVATMAAGFPDAPDPWLFRNASLVVLPFLAGALAQRAGFTPRQWLVTAAPFVVLAIVVNLFPGDAGVSTQALVATHLPVVVWFVIAHPYTAGRLGSSERRMDFVRFTGEWAIYYVLIALGGGVLMGLTAVILEPTGVDEEWVFTWVLPAGAAGAVVVAAWLVESKQRVIENMAPVLTMVFTPLFALMITGAAIVYATTGLWQAFDRELLGIFDALLVVVLGLVLYGMSARDPEHGPDWMDRIQLVAVLGALVLDAMVLGVMVTRVGDLGFTPNRAAALGLNLVLLVNLVGTAWLSARFLAGRATFHRIETWQTDYLPVFAAWALVVVVVIPPLFGFA